MPSRAVEDEDGVSARRDRLGDLAEMPVHCFGIGIGHDEACAELAHWANGAEQVGPLVARVPHGARTGALSRPEPGQRALLPYAGLVLKPDFEGLGPSRFRQPVA
jgi:hypothetical protein